MNYNQINNKLYVKHTKISHQLTHHTPISHSDNPPLQNQQVASYFSALKKAHQEKSKLPDQVE
jgi:hypothetical protein